MKKGFVYILECCDGTFYTGSTKDLELRLDQHKNGIGAKYTARRLPVKLLYSEEFTTISEAFYREKQIQGWSRIKKEALIKNKMESLPKFSECKNETHYSNKGASTPLSRQNNLDE
ncbi:GIY-YIG nuclease family protein [Lutibacter sp.]